MFFERVVQNFAGARSLGRLARHSAPGHPRSIMYGRQREWAEFHVLRSHGHPF